ncbi:hypothetical protein ACHAW5_003994 [Stephanodiscus triporus]|uniref:Pseudouridine synthase I TruA alpha/beta domain-containing protein n=1 Tax=Stephanodiscus triporus TaxID=2934178 RepID=A0ABD3MIX6_9STRA
MTTTAEAEASGSFLDRVDSLDPSIVVSAFVRLVTSGKVSIDDAEEAMTTTTTMASMAPPPPTTSGEARPALTTNDARARTTTTMSMSSSSSSSSGEKMKTKALRRRSTTTTANCRTRHVALQFSYDGTRYSGFAQNVGVTGDDSVERVLFDALEKTRLLVVPSDEGEEEEEEEGGENEEGGRGGGGGGVAKKTTTKAKAMDARAASGYSRCGRTDRGVHAHGQVVALRLRSAFPPGTTTTTTRRRRATPVTTTKNHYEEEDDDDIVVAVDDDSLPRNSLDGLECLVPSSEEGGRPTAFVSKTIVERDYPRVLNGVLPPDVRVLGWCPVSDDFSARFSCSSRTYRYYFPRRYLDLRSMSVGLRYMMGRHDFRNLCKMNCEQVYNFERVLVRGRVVSPQISYDVHADTDDINDDDDDDDASVPRWEEGSSSSSSSSSSVPPSPRDMCHVEIVGQAFLWHQIRCIMSVLFYVGRGLESPTLVRSLLDVKSNPAKPSYDMASESALVLHRCEYANLNFGRTVRNLWDVTKALERRWEDHAIAAERARDALDSLRSGTEVRWTDLMEFVEKIADGRGRKRARGDGGGGGGGGGGDVRRELLLRRGDADVLSWGSAVDIIEGTLGVRPHPPNGGGAGHVQKGQTETSVHVPIMERSRGTTYEEKVRSILAGGGDGAGGDRLGGSRRKERYEENVIRKRKTTEEDAAFYNHKLQQGGSGI